MTSRISSVDIMRHNQAKIAAYIYTQRHVTKKDVEQNLGLSMPTVTKNLQTLEEQGLISKGGFLDSTGGRKAHVYEFKADSRVAIGVSVRKKFIRMYAIDLAGTALSHKDVKLNYEATEQYYNSMGQEVTAFARSQGVGDDRIIGVAFAVQGLVSKDGQRITFGSILGDNNVTLTQMSSSIPFPCLLIHDSDATAMAELWFDPSIKDAVCLYLETRPGGAVIVGGRLYQGPYLSNGTVEHMTLVPGGKLCYCGQRGCADPYCSPESLLEPGQTYADFFSRRAKGDSQSISKYDTWMDYVAQTINNMRMLLASDVIVGGEAARYLTAADFEDLKKRVVKRSAFGASDFTLSKSTCRTDQNIVGAALRYVENFIDDVTDRSPRTYRK